MGIARRDEHGDLVRARGSRLPVMVDINCSSLTLKSQAIDKHANHNQAFCALETYELLYPDLSEVLFIPGKTEKFKLSIYKEDLGKAYSQLVFYLYTKSCTEKQ